MQYKSLWTLAEESLFQREMTETALTFKGPTLCKIHFINVFQ